MEVMASQHHDDISVACIDDKCHVLGLSEFYRYMYIHTCIVYCVCICIQLCIIVYVFMYH